MSGRIGRNTGKGMMSLSSLVRGGIFIRLYHELDSAKSIADAINLEFVDRIRGKNERY